MVSSVVYEGHDIYDRFSTLDLEARIYICILDRNVNLYSPGVRHPNTSEMWDGFLPHVMKHTPRP